MIELHSCSYFCERPACIKVQRDEMRDSLFDQQTIADLQQKLAASERECEKHANAVAVYNEDCIAAEKKIAELERGVQEQLAGANRRIASIERDLKYATGGRDGE